MLKYRIKRFSAREKVPADIMERAKDSGVIQKDHNGEWRIISMKKGEFWDAHYKSRESAGEALRGYQANKHG